MKTQLLPFWLALVLGLSACRSQPSEPAPPAARFELVTAPPGARGARAAGTDAAPPPPSELGAPDPDEPEPGESDDEADGGTEADGAVAAPDSDGGVAL
jgi:hypothetical protein